jgi:hypothetical protein
VFPKREDSTGDLVMREIVAPPGSKATSRTEGKRWNMRGPTGSVALVRDGDIDEATPESMFELRSGVGFARSTDETAEGNEAGGGKGRTRRALAQMSQGRTQSRTPCSLGLRE